jgi:hypothetical protein
MKSSTPNSDNVIQTSCFEFVLEMQKNYSNTDYRGESSYFELRKNVKTKVIDNNFAINDDSFNSFFDEFKLTETKYLSYDDFKDLRIKAPHCLQCYFTPKNFLRFPQDSKGSIQADIFFR